MLEKELEKYFSFSQFRPGQREVVEAIGGADADRWRKVSLFSIAGYFE